MKLPSTPRAIDAIQRTAVVAFVTAVIVAESTKVRRYRRAPWTTSPRLDCRHRVPPPLGSGSGHRGRPPLIRIWPPVPWTTSARPQPSSSQWWSSSSLIHLAAVAGHRHLLLAPPPRSLLLSLPI
ncbi:hypothetical protein E2562_020178 [Oryza meyeriana var. granulata]|uniref:Uncharacterized protein n=1 Tax=Oryza meyeriana var. granulata TaxID=110450 RepID=A0A6G1BM13_9ORYZ|nr:hypothetical protein E2562_020178 [Oryza meyeriana var. granulata]